MHTPTRLVSLAATLATILFSADLPAQGIATITTCKGDVKVVDAATRTPRTVTVLPDTGRVSGGTLASGDEIRTGSGAGAAIRFADGSTATLEAGTRLNVSEVPTSTGIKSIRRSLRLDAGRIACDIKSNKTVNTSIRTPGGVVGIRGGTTATVASAPGRCTVGVTVGRLFVLDPAATTVFTLGNGQQMEMQVDDAQAVTAKVTAAGGRSVSATVGDTRMTLTDGNAIRVVDGGRGTVAVTVVAGPVMVVRDGKTESQPDGSRFTLSTRKPVPAGPSAATGLTPDEERDIPPVPTVPIIRSTIEASPMD